MIGCYGNGLFKSKRYSRMLKRQIVNQELEGRRDGMESDSQKECNSTVM